MTKALILSSKNWIILYKASLRHFTGTHSVVDKVQLCFSVSCFCAEFFILNRKGLAWMPDELSPAHNIVCSGSSVWHRSVEEKLCLVWKPTRPIKLSGRALYDDGQMIRPIKLSGRASYDAGQIPRAELPGRERGSRAGPRAGLPGRGAAELRAPARGTHGARTWLRGGALPARGGFHSHLETFGTF